MTELEQATEWQRRRNLPGVDVRRMFTKRTTDIVLSICGREIASRIEITKRDKIVQTLYIFSNME